MSEPTSVNADTNASNQADIVVGVDGSDESFTALKWALKEAALTGQSVNAVFGWTHSWDMGDDEPDTDDDWAQVHSDITKRLQEWVEQASQGIDFNPAKLKLTSAHASGSSALLQIGKDSQQIVVGRRSLGRVARWFMGSLSASLAEEAEVPVTVVRIAGNDDESTTIDIANALTPSDVTIRTAQTGTMPKRAERPVVVGVDGSETSLNALDFAVHQAQIHHTQLDVVFCWQMKDLGTIEGYENAIAPIEVAQQQAERTVAALASKANIPSDVAVQTHAFHISPAKGLIAASRYASHLVVGSRGLNNFDAHFLGSVSRQIVNFAECTVTVVH